MTFTGWLSLGGNEILNTPRAVGISQSATCPAFWLKENWCLSLRAVLGDAPYVHANVQFAPWYDPAQAELSSRFYGAYGIDIQGLDDSTRQVQKTEGISDGGVLGRTRKGMRDVRVRAVLLADGDDALAYGRAWLEAALDPDACGQHGGECGTSDLEFFATCPPDRGIVNYFSDWNTEAENLFTNPNLVGSGTWAEVQKNYVRSWSLNSGTGWYVSATTCDAETVAPPFGTGIAFRFTSKGAGTAQVEHLNLAPAGSWSLSVWMRKSSGASISSLGVQNRADTFNWLSGGSASGIVLDGTWREVRLSEIAGQSATRVGVILTLGSALGEWVEIAYPTVSSVVGAFDGSTKPADLIQPEDFRTRWLGAANASESVLEIETVRGLTGVRGVAGVSTRGGKPALRIVPTGGATPETCYAAIDNLAYMAMAGTFLGTSHRDSASTSSALLRNQLRVSTPATISPVADASGSQEHRHTYAISTKDQAAFYGDGAASTSSTWWTDIGLFAGVYNGAWFSATTPGDDLNQYRWSGTPDASASIHEVCQELSRPQTDEEWRDSIDETRRFLHGVGATSGPFTMKEMRKGRHVGQLIEFTLTAERPWVHGITRSVELPTTQSSVVEDVQYNLVPYPSMEIAGANIVISENLSLNPSVETNATGWAHTANPVPPAYVTSGRSTELAAVGTASFRVRLLGDGSTAGTGRANVQGYQDIALPVTPARARFSVNVWGALIKSAGSAITVLHTLDARVDWLNASNGFISSVSFGAAASMSGHAFTRSSLLPPPGAVTARVIVRGDVTWESSATPANNSDIRLYVDALAVTTP